MTSHHDPQPTFDVVAARFLDRFDNLAEGDPPLAESILVGGPGGFHTVTRDAYLAGVRTRAGGAASASSERVEFTATPLGTNYGLVTARWRLTLGPTPDSPAVDLVSDFILDTTDPETPRCVTYLTRQDLFERIAAATTPTAR